MAIDIKFSKFDNTPWGFRLTGGSEYGFPMTVVRVYEGGLAESFGLREGDILVALNEHGLVGVSHESVHEYITRAGNNFIATVLRGTYNMEDLEKFTARIEKQPLFPSCLSQESINNYNNSLTTTPTPLLNGTFVNKVPSEQETSSSPCPTQQIPSPTSLFKPVAKTYKPFTKDINTILPPLEKPQLAKSPMIQKDDFQTIKQKEFLETAKKLVPDINKYVDKKNIGRSTPTFVLENMMNAADSITVIDGVERSKFEVNMKEYKSVQPAFLKTLDKNGITEEMNEKREDINVKCEEIKTESQKITNDVKTEHLKIEQISVNGGVVNGSANNGHIQNDAAVIEKKEKVKEVKEVNNVEKKVKRERKEIKDDVIINGGILLDLNEIEKSAKIDDRKGGNEKIIEIVNEYGSNNMEENAKQEVRKSVKCMVEDYTRATTPSPSLYKMSCRIKNPPITPIISDPVNVIEEVKIIKEEIIHYSPVPKPLEPKPKVIEKPQKIIGRGALTVEKCKAKTPCPSPIMFSKEVHELSTSDLSLEEAKINAISAASVLSHEAKQRNYKIPCVSANIPSQNQTDVLLKTFFIHLTDVMVALTKMITNNECCHCGRVISECTHKTKDVREQSETVSNLVKEISERVSNTQMFKESSKVSEKTTDRMFVEKPPEKKIVQKSEAVQTEALKEVFQNTSKLGVDVTVNGKDPLLWLADLDENKIMKTDESKKIEVTSETKAKEEKREEQIYVSESKVESKKAEVIQNAKTAVESITSTAVESIASKVTEETTSIQESKKSLEEQKVEIVEIESKAVEQKKEESIMIQETGENEYSVCLSRPKPQKTEIIPETEQIVEQKEEMAMESQSVKSIVETEHIKEASLHMEETSATMVESENIEYVEEVTTEPIKKVKKPKKKKMMKVIAKDPQTPNTDEFFFRLDVKVEGLRKTPEPIKEHEDFSIVRRPDQASTDQGEIIQDPQSIADKKSSLKLDLRNKPDEVFVLVCQPSSEDSTPSGEIVTKKTAMSMSKEIAGTIKSELTDVKTAKAELESVQTVDASVGKTNNSASVTNTNNLNNFQSNVCNLSANSKADISCTNVPLIESDVPKETIGTCVVESVVNVEQQKSQASAHASSFIQTNDESSKLATDSKSATLQTKESQIMQNGHSECLKAETKVTSSLNEVKMCTSEMCEKKEQINLENNICKEVKEVEAVKQKTYETTARKLSAENITQTKEADVKQVMLMDTKIDQQNLINFGTANGELKATNGFGSMIEKKVELNGYSNGFNHDVTESVTEESAALVRTKEANIGYATVDASRITNGTNGQNGVSEEDLGKPGLTDDEIADILTGEAEVLKDQHVIGINFNKMMPVIGFLKDSEVFKVLNEESIKSRAELLEEQRKQTKFLQKPNRPIPFCKRLAELQSKESSYKVDIRSQKRRESDTKSSILTEGVFLVPEVPILVPEPPPELYVAPEYLEDSAFPDLEDTGIPLPQRKPETPKPEDTAEEPAQEGETEGCEGEVAEELQEQVTAEEGEEMKDSQGGPWKEMVVDETIDESLPVEEQLLKVQKQLEALSKLPAAIQHTLDIVTKQLVKMVPRGDTPAPTEENRVKENGATEENMEQRECTEIAEITESVMQNGTNGQCSRAPSRNDEGRKSVQFEDKVEIREINSRSSSVTSNMCTMSEDGGIQKMKQDVIDQLAQEHMSRQVKQRPTPQTGGPTSYKTTKQPAFGPLTPVARPVVLPGGRKWRGPKDAFTDTFIAETLSGQATVIQGKAIGNHPISSDSHSSDSVDFLKYNKPPISLDHLKDSPVYKLIHEIEDEPEHGMPQGVGNRPKVIAESEYREKCRSVTPNHMENGGAY